MIPRSILAALFFGLNSASGLTEWSDDFSKSTLVAKDSGKDLLIDFTGSDWCSWCIKLRKEVFAQEEFDKKARDHFELVELDYPKDKSKLSEQVQKQNAELLERYPIKGYPTVLLCDTAGRPFAATGYRPGGPVDYLKHLDELLLRKAARDQAFEDAVAKEGVERARALLSALDGMELDSDLVRISYPEIADQIVAADPTDETGFQMRRETEVKFAEFMKKLGELRSKQDLDGVEILISETLKDPVITGEARQQVHGHHAGTLASAGKKDQAIAVLQAAVKEDPDGGRTKELSEFIDILRKEQAKK